MRFTQTARLMAIAVLLLVATAVIWWGIGFRLGEVLLDNASAWRAFEYGAVPLVRLFALAVVVPLTIAIASSASPQTRWIALGAAAIGAVLLYGADRNDGVSIVLFVLAAAAVSEASGTQQITTALVASVVVAFAALVDLPVPTAQKAFGIIVRAVFFYAPLLLGPTYVEGYALKRIAK